MSYYIRANDQQRMIELAAEYNLETNNGEKITSRANRIMDEYFTYADKIIVGIIPSPMYKYWQFEEMDDLISVARMHILKSIQKEQFDPNKGKYFDFISTVVSNNLRSFTLKQNRNRDFKSNQCLDDVYQNEDMTYNHDMETGLVVKEVFAELKIHFEGRGRFVELTELLEDYYHKNIGKKFVKKHFIEVAMGYCFSPSLVNTYFNHIRRLKSVKRILFGDE